MIIKGKHIEPGYIVEMIMGNSNCNSDYNHTKGKIKRISTTSSFPEFELNIISSDAHNYGNPTWFSVRESGWDFKVLSNNDWDI